MFTVFVLSVTYLHGRQNLMSNINAEKQNLLS